MMNTINESSELSSSKTTMAPTTTFSKSTKKGLAVLAALCMLSFYTGHLSRCGDGAQFAVSLLRNEKLDDVKNDIVDNDGVGILSTKSHPCKFDNTSCLSFTGPCINSCPSRPDGSKWPSCLRACQEERVQICQELYPKTRAAEVRNRTPNSCDWCKKYS